MKNIHLYVIYISTHFYVKNINYIFKEFKQIIPLRNAFGRFISNLCQIRNPRERKKLYATFFYVYWVDLSITSLSYVVVGSALIFRETWGEYWKFVERFPTYLIRILHPLLIHLQLQTHIQTCTKKSQTQKYKEMIMLCYLDKWSICLSIKINNIYLYFIRNFHFLY